jgi:alkylhydroperoxidase/carboxymuconolactone decarboxylase family protein YurZ
MTKAKAPRTFDEFIRDFPELGKAWEILGRAGRRGPLDAKQCELLKLGIAIASRSEGAVHSAVRKSRAAGATAAEQRQVLLLCTSTIGLPATVAAYTWMRDEGGTRARSGRKRRAVER